MDSLTTTSLACLLRQAAPHGMPAIGLLLVLIPQALSSVNISVKKPGSAFIRSILPLSRFTIRRHLEIGDSNIMLLLASLDLARGLFTYPRIYLWNLRPKMVSTDNWFHFPCTSMTNKGMLKQMLAVLTPWSLHRRPIHVLTYRRKQRLLDLWKRHPGNETEIFSFRFSF